MENVTTFGQVLEAADQLSLDEQETLADILRRRIIERRRQQLAAEIREARQEYKTGDGQTAAPDELFAFAQPGGQGGYTVEYEQEQDGRWIAEILEIPGALAYGQTRQEALARVQALALRVLADRIEHQEEKPSSVFSFVVA